MHRPIAFWRGLTFCHVGLALLAFTGCSSTGDVMGTVSYRGQTVASGTVIILGSDLLPYSGAIQDDGSYVVSNVPTGLAKITVISLPPRPGKQARSPLRMATNEFEEVG